MKNLSFIAIALIAFFVASCSSNGTTSGSKTTADSVSDTTAIDSASQMPSQEVVDELSKAVTEEHADANAEYKYDPKTNTVTIVKQVDVPANQAEEDYAEALVEHEAPEFITQFKKSTKPSDVTIKSKGATITVTYVNKANGEALTQFDITPDDLK